MTHSDNTWHFVPKSTDKPLIPFVFSSDFSSLWICDDVTSSSSRVYLVAVTIPLFRYFFGAYVVRFQKSSLALSEKKKKKMARAESEGQMMGKKMASKDSKTKTDLKRSMGTSSSNLTPLLTRGFDLYYYFFRFFPLYCNTSFSFSNLLFSQRPHSDR